MNSTIKIKIIIGSTRQGRFSEKPAHWIFEEAKKLEGVEVELLDLRDYEMPFFDSPMSPSMAQGKYENEVVRKWSEKINDGDAFIVVAPEYNHGYTAVLKNAMDVIYPEWNRKPIGFVSYGGVGGARAVEQLRTVAIELQMAPIPNAVHIPGGPWNLLDENGNVKKGAFAPFENSASSMLDQLIWWGRALKSAREQI